MFSFSYIYSYNFFLYIYIQYLYIFNIFFQCRQRNTTYRSKLQISVQWKVDNQISGNVSKAIAHLPIMVKVNMEIMLQ